MAGLLRYLRFIVRRERIISSIWIAVTVVFTMLIAAIYPSLLEDEVSKTAIVEMLKSPAMVGMMGAVYGAETYTVAMTFAHMMMVWMLILSAVANIFFVNRHTRVDEEHGRLEMLRSLPIGRLTNAIATMIGAVMFNLAIALLTAGAIMIVNFEGCTAVGAFAYAFSIGAFGCVMAGATLLCAQLFSTSRGSAGAAFGLLGLFYVMRAMGDYSDSVVSYISPMGLALRTYSFYQNNVYPIAIMIATTAAFAAVSFWISLRRDLGEGVIPARKGRASASKSLLSPLGFAIRLTKNMTIVWCAVVFVMAVMYGSLLSNIEEFVQGNDFYRQLLHLDQNTTNTLLEQFIALLFVIMAHFAVIPVIQVAGKLRSEESRGRLDQIFARSVCRVKMLLILTLIAFAVGVLTMLCTALGFYVSSLTDQPLTLGSLTASAMCYIPAMWVFAAIAVLLTGVFPRGGIVPWIWCGFSFVVIYLGGMLNLPEFLSKLTPFGNVPQLPVQEFNIVPLIIMTAIALLFAALGIWRFRQRDIG